MSITDLSQYRKGLSPGTGSLDDWLSWQEKLHFTAIELGLDRCRKVADAMRLLPPSYFVISIAGTNGKGSCAVLLDSILRKAGYRTGLYTSPHLVRYNERIRLNGAEASDAELCGSFARINNARESITLTYFEFGTLAAMDIFQRNNVDIAIMEVGMGGRLDAVNMLDANVSLISTIDIDHEKWLGNDRETMGREKAGIFRSMRPAVCADPDPPRSVIETADLVGANLVRSGHDFHHEILDGNWSWRSGVSQYQKLPVPGNLDYQVGNASGVLMVIQAISAYFPVDQENVVSAMHNFRMPGRFQIVPGEVPLILDVAHNRQSAAALAENLGRIPVSGRSILVLGMLKDKNHSAFMQAMLPHIDTWYLSSLDDARGAGAEELSAVLKSIKQDLNVMVFEDLEQALMSARENARSGDRLIVTGSFVTVGKAISLFGIGI
jgi:dihydrofolate synthase/folylpolyglutamate synthase